MSVGSRTIAPQENCTPPPHPPNPKTNPNPNPNPNREGGRAIFLGGEGGAIVRIPCQVFSYQFGRQLVNLVIWTSDAHSGSGYTCEETKIYSLAAIVHHMYPAALFNNPFMRHPENSVLAGVPKIKQSHHEEKKRNLKDADMK